MHRKNQGKVVLLTDNGTVLGIKIKTIYHANGGIAYMEEIKFYENAEDELLRFAVIISKSQNKYIFCKHQAL